MTIYEAAAKIQTGDRLLMKPLGTLWECICKDGNAATLRCMPNGKSDERASVISLSSIRDDTFELIPSEGGLESLVQEVIDLYNNTPKDGPICDADTVLCDIMESADWQVPELAMELLGIWKNSNDKDSVAAMFYTLTGTPFEDYLCRCVEETTRGGEV